MEWVVGWHEMLPAPLGWLAPEITVPLGLLSHWGG